MIALVPLFVVAVVAVVAIVAVLSQSDRHANQVSRLLAHAAQREIAWARERHDLNTRIQVPGAAASLAPPDAAGAVEVLRALGLDGVVEDGAPTAADPDDVDESWKVGLEAPQAVAS